MEWVPAPTPINENRRAQAVEKTGIIGTDQIYLFDIYVEIAKDISGYDAGSFSLYDSQNQCMISEIGKPEPREIHRKADKAASICSYVLLEKNPLIVFDLKKHDIFKYHPAVESGMVHSYCGFPVRNNDGYAMGTFCIFHFSGIKKLSKEFLSCTAENIKEIFSDAILISLIPPSYKDLEDRLRGRALDTDNIISKRLSESKREVSKCLSFDFLILNDEFNKALDDLKDIIFNNRKVNEFKSRVSNELTKNLLDLA